MNTSMRTRSIVAVLVVSAIAPVAPAAAGVYGPLDESPQTAQRNEASSGSGYESINAIVPPASEPSSVEPGYTSANAITGPPTGEPTIVSSPAGDSADGFDWGEAALGAGAANGRPVRARSRSPRDPQAHRNVAVGVDELTVWSR
jgi:hypothetical protein